MDKIVTSVSRLSMFPKQCTAHVVTCVKDVNLFNIMSGNFSSFTPPRFVLASFVSTVFSTCWGFTRPENKSKICQMSTAMSKNDNTKNKEKSRANVSFSKLRSLVGMKKFKK